MRRLDAHNQKFGKFITYAPDHSKMIPSTAIAHGLSATKEEFMISEIAHSAAAIRQFNPEARGLAPDPGKDDTLIRQAIFSATLNRPIV